MKGLAGLALALVVTGLAGALPAAAQSSRPEIRDIRFHGNEVFDDDRLQDAIANRETRCSRDIVLPLCWLGIDAALDRRYLQPSELPLDVLRLQAFYWLRGYREAQVDTTVTRTDGQVEIDFDISEGLPVLVDSLEIFGLEDVEADGVQTELPLRVGDPLSSIRIQAVKDTLVSRLREVGYAYAAAYSGFFIPSGSREAQVTFNVDPGPASRFGEVRVDWLPGPDGTVRQELDETSVRRMVPFQQGQPYRYSQLVEGQRNLYNLELIRTARVVPRPDTVTLDSIIPVDIRVGEGSLRRVRAGAGWSTADCVNTEAEWASRNFQGGARRLTLRGRLGNILAPQLSQSVCNQTGSGVFAELTGQFAVELFQPWVFSPRNSLRLNAFVERQSLRDVFVREALGFNVAVSRNIGRQAQLTFSWEPALTRLPASAGEFFFCVSFLLCSQQDIEAFSSARWLSPVGLNLALNRSNRLLNPTAGYSLQIDLEHASDYTASEFPYNRALAEVTAYVGLSDNTVLAARVRGGIVNPGTIRLNGSNERITNPQKRFYSGGAASVRGFGENRLGPRVLSVTNDSLLLSWGVNGNGSEPVCTPEEIATAACDASALLPGLFGVRPTGGDATFEANLELRFPLVSDQIQGALFVDAGQVWARDTSQDRALQVDFGALEVSPGVGLRYFSPIGPIRLDVGYRFRDAENLPVLVRDIAPCSDPGTCTQIRIRNAGGESERIPWQQLSNLRRLDTEVNFGAADSFWRRLQLHFSIGQPF